MKQQVSTRNIFIRTFGWQMGAVLYDFVGVFEDDI